MTWRLAKSLETLRRQINEAYPNRSKVSDGTIGDRAHANRKSDHNPDADGVVRALDLTHDPDAGLDIQSLCNALVASRDPRIRYLICNGKIIAGRLGPSPWKSRKYDGDNPHSRHIHISVLGPEDGRDNPHPWNVGPAGLFPPNSRPEHSVLKPGSNGPFVRELQRDLAKLGYGTLEADGDYGEHTERVVKSFQLMNGLKPDGWAGPRTLSAIAKRLKELETKPKIDHAEEVVEQQTGRWRKITGAGGLLGTIGSFLYGVDWQTVLTIAGVAIGIVLLLVVLRRPIIAAVRDLRSELG